MDRSSERTPAEQPQNISSMPGHFIRSTPRIMQINRPIQMPSQMHLAPPPLMPPMPTANPWMPRPPHCVPQQPQCMPTRPCMSRARQTRPSPMRSPCGLHHCSQQVISPLEREMREQGLFNCCQSIMYDSDDDLNTDSMQLRMTVAQMERNANNNLRNSRRNGANINADTQREGSDDYLLSEMVGNPRERVPLIEDLPNNNPLDLSRPLSFPIDLRTINNPMGLNISGRRVMIDNLLRDLTGNDRETGSLLWNLPSTNNSMPENNYVEWAQAYANELQENVLLGQSSSVTVTVYADQLRTFFNIEHVRATMRATFRATNALIPVPSRVTVSNRNNAPMENPMPSVNGNKKVAKKAKRSAQQAVDAMPSASIAPKPETRQSANGLILKHETVQPSVIPTSLATIQVTSEPPSDSASKQETSQPSSSDDSQPTTSMSSQNNGSATKQQATQDNILMLDGNSKVPESPPLKKRLRSRSYTPNYCVEGPNKRNKKAAKANEAVANAAISLFDSNSSTRNEGEVDKKDSKLGN